jgi:hypothetical protein
MKTRHDGSTELGQNAETRFEAMLQSKGSTFRRANRHEDMFQHWDFLATVNEQSYKIEVKSMKRARRSDVQVDPTLVYVEFLNVIGNPGWLYGQADLIALEQPTGFVVVQRKNLVVVAERLTNDEWANRPTLYKKYRRKDRPLECVSVLHISDITLSIPFKFAKG